jgi:hypothetical protein
MEEYKTKSVVIGRKKAGEDKYNCIINLFESNNPHLNNEIPKDCLEYENINHIIFTETKILEYFLLGNDIVINNLSSIKIEQKDNKLTITTN